MINEALQPPSCYSLEIYKTKAIVADRSTVSALSVCVHVSALLRSPEAINTVYAAALITRFISLSITSALSIIPVHKEMCVMQKISF
jgi:hypothetical protein